MDHFNTYEKAAGHDQVYTSQCRLQRSMSWTQEVQSFPPVPIDELYSNAKKWAEKGEWKKQKDLAIKKAVAIVTCMVGLLFSGQGRDSTDSESATLAQLTLFISCRTAACCLTGSLVWSWAMQSTSAMLEVCTQPPFALTA